MKTTLKIKMTSKLKTTTEDTPKKKDNLKYEVYLKNDDTLNNLDHLKKKMTSELDNKNNLHIAGMYTTLGIFSLVVVIKILILLNVASCKLPKTRLNKLYKVIKDTARQAGISSRFTT